jgi:hypothetical protein
VGGKTIGHRNKDFQRGTSTTLSNAEGQEKEADEGDEKDYDCDNGEAGGCKLTAADHNVMALPDSGMNSVPYCVTGYYGHFARTCNGAIMNDFQFVHYLTGNFQGYLPCCVLFRISRNKLAKFSASRFFCSLAISEQANE